jgi:hypothetical protein
MTNDDVADIARFFTLLTGLDLLSCWELSSPAVAHIATLSGLAKLKIGSTEVSVSGLSLSLCLNRCVQLSFLCLVLFSV